MRWVLPVLVILFSACHKPSATDPPVQDPDEDPYVPPEDPSAYHPSLEDFACASGIDGCAAEGPFIEGTCCTYGSPLIPVGNGTAAEAVDLEVNESWAILCGGFGARINWLGGGSPAYVGAAGNRCQRVAFGEDRGDRQLFYIAHHGDSWVDVPYLGTYAVHDDGEVQLLGTIADPATLFEGMAWADDTLYVATHGGGLHLYDTAGTGVPVLVAKVTGFDNAAKLDVQGDVAYVTDGERLQVVWLGGPGDPAIVATVELPAQARDVDVHGDRVYVAMGGAGVEVLRLVTPTVLEHVATVPTEGSIQAVSADGDRFALAAWSHVQIRDAQTLQLLGSRKTRPYRDFEQDLGVVLRGDDVYVAEWEALRVLRHRPGYVAPDLWIADELFQFFGTDPQSTRVWVSNRGPLPLDVTSITASDPAYYADPVTLTVEPGEVGSFRLHYDPPVPPGNPHLLTIAGNDPDMADIPVVLPIYATDTPRLGVGDTLTADFAFLGEGADEADLSNLEGHVTVLAYFALF